MTEPTPVDDARIGEAIRAAAASWTLPGARPAAPWQDRVARRRGRLHGWPVLLGRGLAGGVVATVVLAFAAVWLSGLASRPSVTSNLPGPGSSALAPASPVASGASIAESPTPSSPTPASSSGLPRLSSTGVRIPATRLVVMGAGGYHLVDLQTGALSTTKLGLDLETPQAWWLADGRAVAVRGVASQPDQRHQASLEIRWFDSSLALVRSVPVELVLRSAQTTQPDAVNWTARPTPDGSGVVIGWSTLQGDGWHQGMSLVDTASGAVRDSVSFPVVPSVLGGQNVIVWAPDPVLSPDGRRAAVTLFGTTGSGTVSDPRLGRYAAAVGSGGFGALTAMPTGPGTLADTPCTDTFDLTFVTDDLISAVCQTNDAMVLRRVSGTGAPLGDSDLRAAGLSTAGLLVGRAHAAGSGTAWFWDAFTHRIAKVDLASGQVLASTTLQIPGAVTPGMLERVGRTIGDFVAPAALAKFYLDPSIVLSPDGSRVYVIGTTAGSFTDGSGGSAGVWVLDATTLAVETWWAPVADYVSIGVSGDGSRLFLVGSPGLDPTGTASPNEASVTVVDTATGEVRLIAGQLGPDTLTLNRVLEP